MTLTRTNYFDHPAVSQSSLKVLDKSPAHYHAEFVARTVPSKDTAALRRGTALHAMLFEADTFAERFPIFEGDKRTNEVKARYAELEARAASLGGCVIREADLVDLHAMIASLRANATIRHHLDRVVASEVPVVWTDPITGTECKAKLDAVTSDGFVLDLKSTRDAAPSAFAKSIYNFGYHIQQAQYTDAARVHLGAEPAGFALVVVEGSAPYVCAGYVLDDEAEARGRAKRIELLTRLQACRESNSWPAYHEGFATIGLPKWAA